MLTPQDFYAHVRAAADSKGRLPVPEQAMWEIFPFEPASLVAKPLDDVRLPEPPRSGEGGQDCHRCANPGADVVWRSERWVLTPVAGGMNLPFGAMLMPREHHDLSDLPDGHAAEMGVICARIARAVEALDVIGRVHLYKFGDGGAHLHVFVVGLPAGMWQLRGSSLLLWDDMLPAPPDGLAEETLQVAVDALADLGEAL